MSERFPQLFWGLVALAAGLVLAALLGAGAIRSAKRAGDQIEVTGSARRPIRSDYAVWRLSVSAQSLTPQEAYGALRGDADQVRAFLQRSGVPDSLVTVRPVETERLNRILENGMDSGELVGYRLTQRFEVRSADVDGITVLSQRANELINQGVPLVSAAPEYLYTKLADVRTQMLAEATKDARERAEAIARSAGSGIGAVRSARMGVFQITPRNSTEVSDYGIYDTSSLEKDITAVVRVTFALD
ncbi:MAG TPA: SIMPL domain-containing protein [Longimicrobiaceae bacterium]|nr:SIMPL domain-containing protein [Longimicrobiaceae bacterium]